MAVWRSAHAPDAFQALIFARGKLAATWSRDQVREGVVQPADFLLLNLVRCSIRSAYRRRLHCRSDARQSRGHVGRLYDVMSHTGEQLLERFSDVNGANVDVFPTSEPPVSRDCELQMPDLHADEEDRHASRFLHLHLRAGSEQTTLCQVLFGPVDASMMLVLVRRAANNKAASSKFQLSQDAASSVAACSRFLRKSGLCEYIDVRARNHVNMKYYFPKFPGLVHFIFVDRCTGEFFAPRMTSLAAMGRFNCGPRARASTKGTGLKSLRAELCQMRNFAHQCNASFPVVTVRKDKIQHVARRWSQDTERMQSAGDARKEGLVPRSWWRFARPTAAREFELYTLHIACLPTTSIANTVSALAHECVELTVNEA